MERTDKGFGGELKGNKNCNLIGRVQHWLEQRRLLEDAREGRVWEKVLLTDQKRQLSEAEQEFLVSAFKIEIKKLGDGKELPPNIVFVDYAEEERRPRMVRVLSAPVSVRLPVDGPGRRIHWEANPDGSTAYDEVAERNFFGITSNGEIVAGTRSGITPVDNAVAVIAIVPFPVTEEIAGMAVWGTNKAIDDLISAGSRINETSS